MMTNLYLTRIKRYLSKGYIQSIKFKTFAFWAISMVAFMCALIIATHSIFSKFFTTQFYDNIETISERFAEESELAMLVGDISHIKEEVDYLIKLPDVSAVLMLDSSGKVVLSESGSNHTKITGASDLFRRIQDGEGEGGWRYELNDIVVVIKEIRQTRNIEVEYYQDNSVIGVLGYAVLKFSTRPLRTLEQAIFTATAVAGVLFLVVMGVLFGWFQRRVFGPFDDLMSAIRSGIKHDVRANALVTTELTKLSDIYNKSLDAQIESKRVIVRQKNELASEVRIRTLELEQAKDAAVKANANKDTLLRNISHELKTPLQSIMGCVELTLDSARESKDEETVADMEVAMRNSQKLKALIEGILATARANDSHFLGVASEFDVYHLLAEVQAMMSPIADEKGNTFRINITQVRDSVVYQCKDAIFHILTNLLSNACKFTENGSVSVEVEDLRSTLVFKVVDSGIGIAEQDIERIFESFNQVDESITRPFAGCGLGLSISRSLAKQIGADIKVSSRLGKGSVFSLHVPRFINTVELLKHRYKRTDELEFPN